MRRRLAILGSTGSIGAQALDVVRKHPDRFEVVALVAGANAEVLAQQIDEFNPAIGALASREPGALVRAATHPDVDVVLNAVVGARGLLPTIAALEAGKSVALANKESLVAGGELVMRLVRDEPHRLLPVDSEHSALFQCLAGNRLADVRRLLITASGGPFRGRTSLDGVSVAEALAHPTWRMGPKITVDSATLMNKGLEAIEAHHLFGVAMDRVEVVLHPQSIVHGIVEFRDGSSIVQASRPDMRLPIQLALGWPERLSDGAEPLDWQSLGALDFGAIDAETFPSVGLAYEAARAGTTYPAALNAANEEAVGAFLAERIAFTAIPGIVADVLALHDGGPLTLDAVLDADAWARVRARERVEART